jgi:hypothetical protein
MYWYCIHLQRQAVSKIGLVYPEREGITILGETSVSAGTYQSAGRNIPKYFNLQQQSQDNIKSRKNI